MRKVQLSSRPRELRYNAPGFLVLPGDVIVSMTGPAAYRVLEAELPRKIWHLLLVRIDRETISPADKVHPLYWNSSKRRRR